MGTLAEATQQLRDMKVQNDKATAEQVARLKVVTDLLEAGAAGNTTPEFDEAMVALADSIQRDDELNPDAPQP